VAETQKYANPIEQPRESRAEIIDTTTREVWQDRLPTPRAWWDGLELEAPYAKAGYGAGSMDGMWFRRSPGAAEDGPVRTHEIGGRAFFCCAVAPGAIEPGTPRRFWVDKHHSLLYRAGRTVAVLTSDAGEDFVLVVEGRPGAPSPALPEGFSLGEVALAEDWTVDLPAPAMTYWFEGLISYQGPVALPASARVVRNSPR
jgi:hypothetical protein